MILQTSFMSEPIGENIEQRRGPLSLSLFQSPKQKSRWKWKCPPLSIGSMPSRLACLSARGGRLPKVGGDFGAMESDIHSLFPSCQKPPQKTPTCGSSKCATLAPQLDVVCWFGRRRANKKGFFCGQWTKRPTHRTHARKPSRSHWRNRVESTDRLSLSPLRDIAFEISQAGRGENERRDYTRDLLALPLAVRQICKSSAILPG